jgi:ribonuclease PH
MADRMNNNEYHIAVDMSKYKQQIVEDLEAVKNRALGTDGKVAVLKKEEIKEIIGRSPDFSDALMMRELLELRTFGWLENM